ncbi:MAG: hypothetical protein SGILL_004122, partial [Bacillariaceae sp.]
MTDALEDTLPSAEEADADMMNESEDDAVAIAVDDEQQQLPSKNGNDEPTPRLMITKM